MDCIAIQSLGHDTALGRGAGRAGRCWGAQVGARRAARRAGAGRHGANGAPAGRRQAAGAGVQEGARA